MVDIGWGWVIERYDAYHHKASIILGHGLMILAIRESVDEIV
jgi:hypothetical protein